MAWDTDEAWDTAWRGSSDIVWSAFVTRGADTLADLAVVSGEVTHTWSGDQVQSTCTIDTVDARGELLTWDLLSPLQPAGQRISVFASMRVGRQWGQSVPLGQYRIMDPGLSDSSEMSRLYPNGVWSPGVQSFSVQCEGLLIEPRRWALWPPTQPLPGGTAASESRRLVADSLPFGDWPVSNPAVGSVVYDTDRQSALVALAKLAGAAPWVGRDGAYTVLPTEIGTPSLTLPVTTVEGGVRTAGAVVRWMPQSTGDGIYNAVLIDSETDDQRPVYGGAYETSGPFAYGGPFGRSTYQQHNPLMKTDALAGTAARTQLANMINGRTIVLSVTVKSNPTIDPLDTLVLQTESRAITGLVISVTHRSHGPTTLLLAVPLSEVS